LRAGVRPSLQKVGGHEIGDIFVWLDAPGREADDLGQLGEIGF
jgi:hypothetical protein